MRFRFDIVAAMVVAGAMALAARGADAASQPSAGPPQAGYVLEESGGSPCAACGGGCLADGCRSNCLLSDLTAPYLETKSAIRNCYGIDVGGWVQAGMTANLNDPHDRYSGPLLTNDRVGDLQMNQLWLYAQRPVDTEGCGVDVGGRFDVFYGTDWRVAYLHGFGLEDLRLNGSDQLYGLSIAQMYAEFAVNDLSVRIGRMTGILGYEVVPPMANFFYSHSFALCYGEPILITGLMSDYRLNDQVKLLAGFHQGVHQWDNNNGELNLQAGVAWTSENQRLSAAYAFDVGRNEFLPALFHLQEEYLQSIVLKYQVSERMLYVAQSDYGYANAEAEYEDADWYGINQYLLYTLGKKWSAGMRVEWFRDDDGTRVLGLGNLDAQGWDGAPGFNGSFTELTLGLNWKPAASILIRPEIRWDWYDGSANLAGELPFDDGNSSTQCTLAADLVVTY
ncbi:MAG: outer membrane beta-barrel protein [Thermoguttaceae bacterium]